MVKLAMTAHAPLGCARANRKRSILVPGYGTGRATATVVPPSQLRPKVAVRPDGGGVPADEGGEARLARPGDVVGGLPHLPHGVLGCGVFLLGRGGAGAGEDEAEGRNGRRDPAGRPGCSSFLRASPLHACGMGRSAPFLTTDQIFAPVLRRGQPPLEKGHGRFRWRRRSVRCRRNTAPNRAVQQRRRDESCGSRRPGSNGPAGPGAALGLANPRSRCRPGRERCS